MKRLREAIVSEGRRLRFNPETEKIEYLSTFDYSWRPSALNVQGFVEATLMHDRLDLKAATDLIRNPYVEEEKENVGSNAA